MTFFQPRLDQFAEVSGSLLGVETLHRCEGLGMWKVQINDSEVTGHALSADGDTHYFVK